MKILWKILKWILILVVLGYVGCQIYLPFENRKLIQYYLGLPKLPPVSATECSDYGFTDVLVKCYFEADPDHFPEFVWGRIWARAVGRNGCTQGPQVGKSFQVSETLDFDLVDEEHGGSIQVCYGKEKNKFLIHYYVE